MIYLDVHEQNIQFIDTIFPLFQFMSVYIFILYQSSFIICLESSETRNRDWYLFEYVQEYFNSRNVWMFFNSECSITTGNRNGYLLDTHDTFKNSCIVCSHFKIYFEIIYRQFYHTCSTKSSEALWISLRLEWYVVTTMNDIG